MDPDAEEAIATRSSVSEHELVVRFIESLLPIKSVLGGRGGLADCGDHGAGLTPRHVQLLIEVLLRGPVSVSTLAEVSGSNLASASVAASQLEAAGLVMRAEDPVDHRRTLVRALPEAEAFVVAFLTTRAAPLELALSQLAPQRASLLVELLDELAACLRATLRDIRGGTRSPQLSE